MAAGLVLAQLMLAVFCADLTISTGLAGTETGEFCCTCPDYDNLDAWLAKKAQLCDQSGERKDQVNEASNSSKVIEVAKGYPEPRLIASASSNFDGMVIIDVRSPEEYQRGHIPGARNLYWNGIQQRGILDTVTAESALRKAGINNSDSLLIYGGIDDRASHIFWALSYLGHRNLTKLDGGIDEAMKAGRSMDRSLPEVKNSSYAIHLQPWILVNESLLGGWLNRTDLQILDARDFSEYGRARLTNASIPLEASKLYEEDWKIRDAGFLDDLLSRRALDKNKTQLVYGTPEAYSLFYGLRLMGYNATLLEDSWWTASKWAVSNIG